MEYIRALYQEFGIDMGYLQQKINYPGMIYGEAAYLLSRLIAHPDMRRFMEAGAGMSTLIYAQVAKQYNKFFVSFEDKEVWADKYNEVLRSMPELVGDFQIIRTESDPNRCPKFTEKFDLAWIDGNLAWHPDKGFPHDCCHRPGSVRYYKEALSDALIIFDDGEDLNCRINIDTVMREMGRDPDSCFIWNPYDRMDRNQWICPPPGGCSMLSVLDEVANKFKTAGPVFLNMVR